MSLADAFAPAEAKYRNAVMAATWGDLAPRVGDHQIDILFASSCYGWVVIIDVIQPTLPDSPWLHQALQDHTAKLGDGVPVGTVWRWNGILRWFQNGNCRFIKGKLTKIL